MNILDTIVAQKRIEIAALPERRIAAFIAFEHGIAQIAGREATFGQCGDFDPLLGDDGVEDVGHGGKFVSNQQSTGGDRTGGP